MCPGTGVDENVGDIILQLGYQRSGSTFLGNVIQESEGTISFFEPLNTLIGSPNEHMNDGMEQISSLITRFMDCSFPKISGYMEWLKKTPYFFNKMKYLQNKCRPNRSLCFNASFIQDTCLKTKRKHIKSFFVPIRRLSEFLQTLSHPLKRRITVVYLVRDPRAILNSRKQRKWCKGACREIASLCREMEMDLRAYDQLKKSMNGRLIMLRYEDMALLPERVTEQLFRTLNLNYSAKIRKFVHDHTHLNATDKRNRQDNIYRSSATRINRWVKQLSGREVTEMQYSCKRVLNYLEYFRVPDHLLGQKVGMRDDSLLFHPIADDFRSFRRSADQFDWNETTL